MTEHDFPPERDVHDALELDFGDVHTPTGATSTSEPHHEVDPQVDPRKANPHERSRPERRRASH